MELDEKELQKQNNDFEVFIIGETFKVNNRINELIPNYYTIYLVHKNDLVLYKENFKYY